MMGSRELLARTIYLVLATLSLAACRVPAIPAQEARNATAAQPPPAILPPAATVPPAVFPSPSNTPAHPHLRVLWDDDGSPDGILALLYFLRNPDVTVEAITVSPGEAHPDLFAENLTRMLARIGRADIPVAAGRTTPLEGDNAFPEPWRHATDTFWEIDLPEALEPVQSVSAGQLIVQVLNESPNGTTVFISGTHTNLAEALRLDPLIADRIASVSVMGGALYVPGNIHSDWPGIENTVAEWNIWVDPVAASEVFNSGLSIDLTPLDATNQVVWTEADAAAWEASGTIEGVLAAEILRWMLRSWFPEGVYAWDLVAAVNATDSDLCRYERVHVQVVTVSGPEQGRTVVVRDQPPNTAACLSPEADAIRRRVAEVLRAP